MIYRCKTHNVTLEIIGSRRTLEIPYGVNIRCYLLTAKEPEKGKHGECEIV